MTVNEWTSVDHALAYLARADSIPHRTEGETVLLDQIPSVARRILDLGTGDGRLLALCRAARPAAAMVGLDFSPPMLEAARWRFAGDTSVAIVDHDLDLPLPDLGRFDAVVSSFAIHSLTPAGRHCAHDRKRTLYAEIFALLEPGGVFCNLEHVVSPTPALHRRFLEAIGQSVETEDTSNKLLDVFTQLQWLRNIGFERVDCRWKWLELALLAGVKPG